MSSCGGQEVSGNSNKLCLKSCVVSLQDTDSDENSDEAPGPWPLRQMDGIFNGSCLWLVKTYGRDAVPSIAVDPEGSIHSTYSKIRLDEI